MVAAENENAVSDLLEAYESELNAHARYKAYAVKAEAEGMCGAASLFRAAARAEQIHASNHARVIRRMGGEIEAEIRPFRVKSTIENLKAALGGEQHEIDSLYARFSGTCDVAIGHNCNPLFCLGHGIGENPRPAL